MKTICLGLALAALMLAHASATEALTIHEWGTFTALQDERGDAIGGINTDDEPVPPFVHDVAEGLLIHPTEVPPVFCQGAPRCHPDVTMRLETPVLYVHAPESFHGPLDVGVAFHGGWLTQFYPQADATTPGIDKDEAFRGFGHLTAETTGKLFWPGLMVNPASGTGPDTTEHVWLAPRQVEARSLQTHAGDETERYLFYRGVGHLDASLRVVRSADGVNLNVQPNDGQPAPGKLWLVDIRPGGTAAWRSFVDGQTPANFAPAEYSAARVADLRADLKTALVADGLFADEADALLNTWELSYFKSAGQRLFFLVPQAWTDRVLPLKVSGATAEVRRVMVGRIELVTPRQRELLVQIAAGSGSALVPASETNFQNLSSAIYGAGQDAARDDLFAGKRTFASLGVTPPPAYRAYLDLGRFRNALLLDEQRRTGSDPLRQFIRAFGLDGYAVPAAEAVAGR